MEESYLWVCRSTDEGSPVFEGVRNFSFGGHIDPVGGTRAYLSHGVLFTPGPQTDRGTPASAAHSGEIEAKEIRPSSATESSHMAWQASSLGA